MAAEQAGERSEPVPLDLASEAVAKRTGLYVVIGGVVFAAALGGVLGLAFGRLTGLIAAVLVGVPLILMGLAERRKRTWLEGTTIRQRGFRVRGVDLMRVGRMEILVADLRGKRTVGITVAGPPGNKAINIALAAYSGPAGAELGILALRRLADVFANAEHSSGLVYSQLLVAQLRAEARGSGAPERPLHQLAMMSGGGVRPRHIDTKVLVRFVSELG
ncbi:hypothetical protein [Sciscionella marina]|uniref:hypothetical protein n=1 Tax=Sciscionella marina TaxID=508770 RepID=UPI000380A0C8|nr:hypothetical protein [Sciscionella marina]